MPGRSGAAIREMLEEQERTILSDRAQLSAATRGRDREEPPDPFRPAFQHDRDRILHSKAFRRLKHKTQVLLLPRGDHYRTRLTHTLEVSQIARTIAKALRLNEDLAEAIALGHDLGHTPFGHAGEAVLTKLVPGGFRHFEQSLRVVERLERDGRGLNLTVEVRDGILRHSKGKAGTIQTAGAKTKAMTLEGRIVRFSDVIAYANHDLDDAFRAGVLQPSDVPKDLVAALGASYSKRINTMVTDVILETLRKDEFEIHMSPTVAEALTALRAWLFERVYESEEVRRQFDKCRKILTDLFTYYVEHPEVFAREAKPLTPQEPLERRVCDFIAGMTDRYAIEKYTEIFMPAPWARL